MADEDAREQPAPVGASPSLGSIVKELLEAVSQRSRKEVVRARGQSRASMELRQLERDRTVMLAKLGREVLALLEGGEVDHPGLRRGANRITRLDEQIAEVRDNRAPDPPEVS